jgi:hypothetical protein
MLVESIRDQRREIVNRWIRSSGAFDVGIDFDKSLPDPIHPHRLLPRYQYSNDAGYAAVAETALRVLLAGAARKPQGARKYKCSRYLPFERGSSNEKIPYTCLGE